MQEWVAGRMCDRFGRKPTLVWMGVLFLISAAGCAVTPSGGRGATALPVVGLLGPHVLGWMRFIGGIAIGGVSVAVPMYIAEIAPPESRGRLVLVNQFCIVLGIVVSYISKRGGYQRPHPWYGVRCSARSAFRS